MKTNRPLLISLILFFLLIVAVIFLEKRKKASNFETDRETAQKERFQRFGKILVPKVDSLQNCDEKVIKKNFLEWMDLMYPDWKILGKLKVFKPGFNERSYITSDKCAYNIRFQTVNPHLASIAPDVAGKEIIIVRFQYNDDYSGYDIKTIRGVL